MKYIFLILFLLTAQNSFASEVLQEPQDFVKQSFAGTAPAPKTLMIADDETKKQINKIMKRKYKLSKAKYWQQGERSVWILEEIGKYKPITTGFVINGSEIENVKVLIYRESHGWEVKYPFFTDQFKEAKLEEDRKLDKSIDGISGATLSVKAIKRLAALALYLDKKTRMANAQN